MKLVDLFWTSLSERRSRSFWAPEPIFERYQRIAPFYDLLELPFEFSRHGLSGHLAYRTSEWFLSEATGPAFSMRPFHGSGSDASRPIVAIGCPTDVLALVYGRGSDNKQ